MNKADFLKNLQATRAEWDALLEQALALGEQSMVSPMDGPERWSVKDIVAHITWYEREILGIVRAHNLLPGVADPLWEQPSGERNRVLYDKARDLPLDTILEDAQQVYKQLWVELQKLDDADLNDLARFPGMPKEWVPWEVLADNSYQHYSQHMDDIKQHIGRAANIQQT